MARQERKRTGRREPWRIDGYSPIGDYGVIGDGRSAALTALDGSIDWLCVDSFDGPTIFSALLDAERGGSFRLAPAVPFEAERRYLPETNVLETTFRTAEGAVRVTDAMGKPLLQPQDWQELVRRVEGLSGSVPMRWHVRPRLGWDLQRGEVEIHEPDATTIRFGRLTAVVQSWEAGEQRVRDGDVCADVDVREGDEGLIALVFFQDQPRLYFDRAGFISRLDETCEYWRRVAEACHYDGPWREHVVRSALTLHLLLHEPSHAMVAAATTSLPERIGGPKNFDYRYCWLRDTSFALEAMMQLGYADHVHAALTWLLRVCERTHPRLTPFYGLDGAPRRSQRQIGLAGYRGSVPVLEGNAAGDQIQLGNYGDLFGAARMYVADGNTLGPDASHQLGGTIDYLCEIWRNPDASIWEVDRADYAQGKLAAWSAFDSAIHLAEADAIAHDGDRLERWRRNRADVERFIEERCWSQERRTWTRFPEDSSQLDAGMLVATRSGYAEDKHERLSGTVEALRSELGDGPLLYRYTGMPEEEGAFVACSFWLVESLAELGEEDEAAEVMDGILGYANDLGLLSEQVDPSGELLGNMPQALSHLSLINAAFSIRRGGLGYT